MDFADQNKPALWLVSLYTAQPFSVRYLTLNLLTTTIVAPPCNASKWQMGFNSAFKGLKLSWTFILTIKFSLFANVSSYRHQNTYKIQSLLKNHAKFHCYRIIIISMEYHWMDYSVPQKNKMFSDITKISTCQGLYRIAL